MIASADKWTDFKDELPKEDGDYLVYQYDGLQIILEVATLYKNILESELFLMDMNKEKHPNGIAFWAKVQRPRDDR